MKGLRLVIWGFALIATALFAGLYLWQNSARQQIATLIDIGGPFRLAAARGGVIDSADLKGKPYGVFFGFTYCPEVCPTTLYEMSRSLATMGTEAGDFRLFFITVDPERDTAAKLNDYVANFDPRIEALVPSPAELADVAGKFRALYEKVPTSDGSYTMNHSASIYLMDRTGQFAGTIVYDETPETRIAKLKKLMAGR